LKYSRKLNLANVTPHSSLCSTGYCLAQTSSTGAEYLVYAPSGGSFTLDLSAMSGSARLAVGVVQPIHRSVKQRKVHFRWLLRTIIHSPFSGDAVLYLVDTAGHATSGISNKK
jgi:hypothetical protein